jgi:cytochrome P450
MSVAVTSPAFPFLAGPPLDLPPEFERLRAEEPVARVTMPSGDRAWLVTRYQDVRTVFADPRFSRAAASVPTAPKLSPRIQPRADSILSKDPPDHTRLRKLVARAFTARRIEQLRPRIQETTDRLLDGLEQAGPPADLVTCLALPLPVMVICELLGVPYGDRDRFRGWTDSLLNIELPPADAYAAREALGDYLAELITDRRAHPSEDLLGHLTAARDEEGTLSEDELVSFGITLLIAGHETTANQIATFTLLLLRHPGQLRRLRETPDLVGPAVEELLRFTPLGVGSGLLRVATTDVELGGVRIRAGEAVIASITAANHDPAVFDDPDRLDIARADNPHLAFGPGIHHCLGAQLARAELQTAIGSLLRRFPGLVLDVGEDELHWRPRLGLRGPSALPVRW